MGFMRAAITVLLGTVSVAVAVTAAPAAGADDQSYLAALDAQGVFTNATAQSRLAAGHKFCNEIRAGSSPDEVAERYQDLRAGGGWSAILDLRIWLRPVIATAQQELCPDTLG